MTQESEMKRADELQPGDIVLHVGLVVGTDWLGLVTAVEPTSTGVVVFETHWPLVSSREVPVNALLDVRGHSDEDYQRALRMFDPIAEQLSELTDDDDPNVIVVPTDDGTL